LAIALVVLAAAAGAALSADFPDRFGGARPPPEANSPVAIDPYRYELRFGAFWHGVGSFEKNTVDLGGEIVSPRLPIGIGQWWAALVPRLHLGGSVNLSQRTNAAYLGALWTFPLWGRLFAEVFVDGAVHDGLLLQNTQTRAALGCNPLFHVGGSLGYSITREWHVMLTFDHLSNGNSLFLSNCKRNQGLNNFGLRAAYSF
jgi:hypothetical protein